jgi:hypothetical protein
MVAIGFSTTQKLSSRLIRWRTRQPGLPAKETPSHAWILHEAYGGQYVMSAEWNGFVVVSYEQFRADNRIIEVVPVVERMAFIGVDARVRVFEVAEWLGTNYDWAGLLRFVVPRLIRGQSPKALLCSEAAARAFKELFPGMDPERSSPSSLLMALRKSKPCEKSPRALP